jgi:hypothetical protein
MINPVTQSNIDDFKFSNEQISKHRDSTPEAIKENGVTKNVSPDTFIKSKEKIIENYDVARYVSILKNKVIPPENRLDTSVLIELELNNKLTSADLRNMLNELEREEAKKESTKVSKTNSDANIKEELVADKDDLKLGNPSQILI